MKIKVLGKAQLKGISKKTGNPYDFVQVHYLGKARGVEGQAAKTLNLDPNEYPLYSIGIGTTYEVEFDERGYVVGMEPLPEVK